MTRTRRTSLPTTILAAICALVCAGAARAQVAPAGLPAPQGFVNDFAGVINEPTRARMERVLTSLKDKAQIEFAVVTVPTTGGQDIFNYSLAVARGWKIGAPEGEKKGLLLLIAVEDRKYQIQVSRHLEGDLPDGLVGEIGRRMRDPFRAGDYSTGVMNAVQTFIATIGKQRGFTFEEVDQSYAYQPQQQRTRPAGRRTRQGGLGLGACCLIAVVLILIFSMFGGRRGGGGWGGGGGGGLLNALLLANVVGSIANSGRGGSSGWGGGGGGSSGWGGGGGGFGGFGGGGDFGGGGAGGDW